MCFDMIVEFFDFYVGKCVGFVFDFLQVDDVVIDGFQYFDYCGQVGFDGIDVLGCDFYGFCLVWFVRSVSFGMRV